MSASRTSPSLLRELGRFILRLPRLVGLALVRVYQLVISPMLPQSCRFYPSCSAYAVGSLGRHGFLWGIVLTVRRLLRCHPWNPGGVDDVPEYGPFGGRGLSRAPRCLHDRDPHSHDLPAQAAPRPVTTPIA